MRTVLLPDFVGFPICYEHLREEFHNGQAIFVDYHEYWPYCSVSELAAAILAAVDDVQPHTIVGYSFGAYVAVGLSKALVERHRLVDLVLIDPPSLRGMQNRTLQDVEAELCADTNYSYVYELAAAGLVDLHCLRANIHMLALEREEEVVADRCTLFIAHDAGALGRDSRMRSGPNLRVVTLRDADHRSVVQHRTVVEHLLRAKSDDQK